MERPIPTGPRKRRHWLIALLVIGALVFGGPLAWRYRPMSGTERELVGVWRIVNDEDVKLTFTRGRRLVAGTDGNRTLGAWHTSNGKLYVSYDFPFPRDWGEVPDYLRQVISRDVGLDLGPIDLEFEGSTRVRVRYRTDTDGPLSEEMMERVP